MKSITLCADDFALSLAGSQRILQLAQMGRLAATSVMVQSPHWPVLAAELKAQGGNLDVGLHFNLTQPFDQHASALPYWLLMSQARALPRDWIRDRLLEQIDLFSAHFQRLPDFIDGHQHVHAFPVIREQLFEAVRLRWGDAPKPYLRAPDRLGHSGGSLVKATVLKLACGGFASRSRARGLATPEWFAGLYSLTPREDFPGLMNQWLASAPAGGLLMCHAGVDEAGDPIGAARAREYQHLASQAFVEQCAANQVVIRRFERGLAESAPVAATLAPAEQEWRSQ